MRRFQLALGAATFARKSKASSPGGPFFSWCRGQALWEEGMVFPSLLRRLLGNFWPVVSCRAGRRTSPSPPPTQSEAAFGEGSPRGLAKSTNKLPQPSPSLRPASSAAVNPAAWTIAWMPPQEGSPGNPRATTVTGVAFPKRPERPQDRDPRADAYTGCSARSVLGRVNS